MRQILLVLERDLAFDPPEHLSYKIEVSPVLLRLPSNHSRTIERLPVAQLLLQSVRGGIVVQLHKGWMQLRQKLCQQRFRCRRLLETHRATAHAAGSLTCIAEVSGDVSRGPRELEAVHPRVHAVHRVLLICMRLFEIPELKLDQEYHV